jgi:hypothetical protein
MFALSSLRHAIGDNLVLEDIKKALEFYIMNCLKSNVLLDRPEVGKCEPRKILFDGTVSKISSKPKKKSLLKRAVRQRKLRRTE